MPVKSIYDLIPRKSEKDWKAYGMNQIDRMFISKSNSKLLPICMFPNMYVNIAKI